MHKIEETLLYLWATPLVAVAIGLEIFLSNLSEKKVYSFKGVLENFYLTTLNMGIDATLRTFSFSILIFFFQFRIIEWASGFWYWMWLLICEDFVYYWLHRVDHHCRLFWAVHVTHHSSEEFNLTVGFRSSVFQPLYRFIYFIPLTLFGFSPLDIFIMYSMTQLYGTFIHTTSISKLGYLEYILVTPSHHRVHHGSNVNYLDRNLGMVFIFWDKMFGTFTPEGEPVVYGLTKKISTRNPVTLVLHEWHALSNDIRSATTLKDKLHYVFGPPGWSHTGDHCTSRKLKSEKKAPSLSEDNEFIKQNRVA